jgi:hypothetical protein
MRRLNTSSQNSLGFVDVVKKESRVATKKNEHYRWICEKLVFENYIGHHYWKFLLLNMS